MHKARINELLLKAANSAALDTKNSPASYETVFLKYYTDLVIEDAAALIDEWTDSGEFKTFGDRLRAHFEVTHK